MNRFRRIGPIFPIASAVLLCIFFVSCAENKFTKSDAQGDTDSFTSFSQSQQCSLCHGSSNNPAPPRDLEGNTDTSFRGVGAHQIHLSGSGLALPLNCTDCHMVPIMTSDSEHVDGDGIAEVLFSDRARQSGANPQWNGKTCSDVYCHGSTLSGGEHQNPDWTVVDGSQTQCGSCHSMPPKENHPKSEKCEACHTQVVDANRNIIAPELHINGVVDIAGEFACTSCHGMPPTERHPRNTQCENCHANVVDADRKIISPDLHINGQVDLAGEFECNSCHGNHRNAAPPSDIEGNSDRSLRTVGLHQRHVNEGSMLWSTPVPCESCHVVPAQWQDEGHLDGTPYAEISFGGLATAFGSSPSWNGVTCSGSYCHGSTMEGGSVPEPQWQQFEVTSGNCGACHGLPPSEASGHPETASCISVCHGTDFLAHDPWRINGQDVAPCSLCHSKTMWGGTSMRWRDKSLHINGIVELD